MALKVWKPRLLVTLIAATLVLSTGAALVFGDDNPGGIRYEPVPGPPPPVTTEEDEAAMRGFVTSNEAVLGLDGIAYELTDFRPFIMAGQVAGAAAHVTLSQPIARETRWLTLSCQGTRQAEDYRLRRNVSTIRIVLHDDGTLLEWVPVTGLPRFGEADNGPRIDTGSSADTSVVVRDLLSGQDILRADFAEPDPAVRAEFMAAGACPPNLLDE